MTHKKLVCPGDRIRAICGTCRKIVRGTFDYRTVPFEDGTPVEGVMAATCDRCGANIAMAPQSAPVVRAAMEDPAERRRTDKKARSTVRIPRVLADFARWELAELQAPDAERFDLLVKAFVMALEGATDKQRAGMVDRIGRLSGPALEQPCDFSVSFYFSDGLWGYLEALQHQAGLRTTSDLIRRIFMMMEGNHQAEAELRKLVLIG